MSLPELAAVTLGVVAAYMVAVWLLSLPLRNASIVDIFWGLGFVVVAAVLFALADGYGGRKALMLALVAVSLPAALLAIGLAAVRVFGRARRLGERADPPEVQGALARSILRDHLVCLASMATLLAAQLTAV